MSTYRNITVNVRKPYRKVDHTAIAIINALANGPMLHSALKKAVAAYPGASLSEFTLARKGLRNVGFEVHCDNRGRHSRYWLNPTSAEVAQNQDEVIRKTYSRFVTLARQLAKTLKRLPGDPTVVDAHRRTVQSAIDFGTQPALGMSLQDVVDDCQPLSPARRAKAGTP